MTAGVSAQKAFLENYLSSTGKIIDQADKAAGFLDRVFALIQHVSGSVQFGSQLPKTGKETTANGAKNASEAAGSARSFISAVRFISCLENLFTGKMFWETRDNRWLYVAVDKNGHPIPDVDANGNPKKDDIGRPVYLPASRATECEGAKPGYVQKDWMSIAIGIIMVVARVLSPLTLLHQLKAIDLGRHAKAMGGAIVGAYAAVVSICLVQSIRDMIGEDHSPEKFADLLGAFFDFIALPFEFGIGMGGSPAIALVGAIVCSLSAGTAVIREFLYYG